jgi:tRNA (guanine-N7-)-methyltransferase
VRSRHRLPPAELQAYLLDLPHPRAAVRPSPGPLLEWPHLFGNDHPVEIEVGCGKGLFLLTQSQARPQVNFLGVEIERKYALFTAARLAKRALPNVRIACSDARWLFQERITPASASAVHVYFPDPWWKNRHRKRRLFTAEFVGSIDRVLQPGGKLHFTSDVQVYFEESLQLVAAMRSLQPAPVPEVEADGMTNFERKYRIEGRPIYRAVFEKHT